MKEDGYALSTAGGILKISGEANGVVYGAVSLLEDYLEVDYWGENEYSLKQSPDISLPMIEKVDNPAFRYRQSQCYAMRSDSIYNGGPPGRTSGNICSRILGTYFRQVASG